MIAGARRSAPCPYCGELIRVGDVIARAYLRVGVAQGWAKGRCTNRWWLHAVCAEIVDDRRRREPPLSVVDRDAIRAAALPSVASRLQSRERRTFDAAAARHDSRQHDPGYTCQTGDGASR